MFLFLPCSDANSQNELISLYPRGGQGYLVWKDTDPNVRFWRVSVFKRTFDTTGTFVDTPEERFDVWNKHFVKIPEAYFEKPGHLSQYLLNLEGMGAQNNVIVSENEIDLSDEIILEYGSPWTPEHYVACNGANFAWKIQQYVHPNGGQAIYRLEQNRTYNSDTQLFFPFYEYMTFDYYSNAKIQSNGWLTPFWSSFHDIHEQWVSMQGGGWNSSSMFGYPPMATVQNSGGLYDFNGFNLDMTLVPNVVAMQKARGLWETNELIQTVPVALTSQGSGDFQQWTLIFNNYGEFPEGVPSELTCPTFIYFGHYNDNAPCVPSQLGTLWETGSNPGDLISPFLLYWDCLDGNGHYQEAWPTTTKEWDFAVSSWKPWGNEPLFKFAKSDLVDSTGYFNGINFTLNPGLYSISGITEGGNEMNRIWEIRNAVNFQLNQSHMLDATVFPVPIVGNTYSINMKTPVDLRFLYELYDGQGTRIYFQNFLLAANHDDDHFIDPSITLPHGILVHRFVFEDGSVKTISTIK